MQVKPFKLRVAKGKTMFSTSLKEEVSKWMVRQAQKRIVDLASRTQGKGLCKVSFTNANGNRKGALIALKVTE